MSLDLVKYLTVSIGEMPALSKNPEFAKRIVMKNDLTLSKGH